MVKKVRYNGGTQSFYLCSAPMDLELGKEYEVIYSKEYTWQTNYILREIDGEFNSLWFDEVTSDSKVYMALSHKIPVVGEKYSCYMIEFKNGQPKLIASPESIVDKSYYIGHNIYLISTTSNIYIVNVN